MGTGKTATGRELARLLGMPFVEMDSEIEKAMSMKIKDIFETHGEDFFREKETEILRKIIEGPEAVVSTGGGVVIKEENRHLMKAHGKVVCLWADIETILKRTSNSADRPLLNVADREEKIRQLLETRRAYYEEADIHIKTDGKGPYEVALEIKEALKI